MRDLNSLTFHPTAEKIVEILCKKTQNDNPEFFRILLCYYLAKVAATMRVKIATRDRGEIPVNLYAVNLAESGHGKGHSTNIIEEQLIHHFRNAFFSETYPIIAEESLNKLAVQRAYIKNEDENVMLEAVKTEFRELGKLAFSFDSGTPAAIKQMRHKLLMSGAGSISWEMDEVGNNLTGNLDLLATFLEMFDVGKIKQKLIKNTKENIRSEEIDGRTPANLLMFGTPSKLFDGAKTEEEFYSLLETGYARRCLFGFSKSAKKSDMTPKEIYDALVDPATNQYMQDLAIEFGNLANIVNHGKTITVSEHVSILTIEYKQNCEILAQNMGEHQAIAKAEMAHRYFKALKLAGIYAFIDGHQEITEDNLYHAICMVEDSGHAFEKILSRDRTYVKLAKYLGTINHEVTHVELTEDLPFYRGSASAKADLIALASAWGYKNQIIIKKTWVSGIEFLRGETLQETDLNRMVLAYSTDISDGYRSQNVPWDRLYKLTQMPGHHWINHHSTTGHRAEENIATGFNMVVLDVDGGATLKEVQLLLKDYEFMVYITKRHTAANNRFRLVMPMNYRLKLSAKEYREFMTNVFEWLPIDVDTQTSQRSRKWLTHPGGYQYNNGGKLLDTRLFIPKTAKNDERKAFVATHQTMTNMERWFLTNSTTGNRNNQLARYALMMVDLGYDITYIQEAITGLNDKLPDGLSKKEINTTILKSAAQKIAKLAN